MLIVMFFANRYFANRYIAPVKEAFIKQKQFITDASHELKTPLTVINTNTDLLLANSGDTIQKQVKWLHHIKGETERMKSLTNDLLYLTEIDHSRNQKIFAPFNISEAVKSIILTMEVIIFEKNYKLNYEIEPGLTVNGNKEQEYRRWHLSRTHRKNIRPLLQNGSISVPSTRRLWPRSLYRKINRGTA